MEADSEAVVDTVADKDMAAHVVVAEEAVEEEEVTVVEATETEVATEAQDMEVEATVAVPIHMVALDMETDMEQVQTTANKVEAMAITEVAMRAAVTVDTVHQALDMLVHQVAGEEIQVRATPRAEVTTHTNVKNAIDYCLCDFI